MDIGTHRPSVERSSLDEKLSLAAENTIYTYHCLCTHLLLATSTPLPSLPTRHNCLDKAHIMPLPPPPTTTLPARGSHLKPMDHYGLMLSTTQDHNAEMIRSDEGFEKRYLQRCGRCGLVVGYQLDWQQFGVEAEGETERKAGRREDMVFLLPGGFVTTSEMIMGKTPPNASISMVGVTEVKV